MSTHTAIAATAKGVLKAIQLPTPAPGPEEVLVHVQYAAMISYDTYQLDRAYAVQDFPVVLGFAGSGAVKALGSGVSDLEVGDRVATFNFIEAKNKSMQEYTLIHRSLVSKVPANIPLDAAASLPDNFVTAFWTLFGAANLALPVPAAFPAPTPPADADAAVLVYGAGASAGQYTVQLLRLAGYTNVLATASPHNHAHLRELGAAQCFDYRAPGLVAEIRAAAGAGGVRTVIDTIAARDTSLKAIAGVVDKGKGARVALLIPVKEGSTVTNAVDAEMHHGVPEWTSKLLEGAEVLPIRTFQFQTDEFVKNNLMPKILPDLLARGIVEPNRIRLLNEGSFKERVEVGLDLLRNNRISGEKVVVEVKV